MTNQKLYELLGDINEKYLINISDIAQDNLTNINGKERKLMNKIKTNFFKRPAIVVTSLAICLCLTGLTALAATGNLQGFFKDIIGFNGAITGTIYEQATNEIDIRITDVSEKLTVEITFLQPPKAPYQFFELFGIKNYQIIDANGKVIIDETSTEMTEIKNSHVVLHISSNNLPAGNYKLIVSEMIGRSKADQPLPLYGTWECDFVLE